VFDISVIVFIVIGYAAAIVAVAKLGAPHADAFAGLFDRSFELGRARGIQETDVPRFVFRDPASVSAA
jgi:hypothetical protein